MYALMPHGCMFCVLHVYLNISDGFICLVSLQIVNETAAVNAEAAEAGFDITEVDTDQLRGAIEEGGIILDVEGAQDGIDGMLEEAAADEIVEGHQYFE